MQTIAHLFDPHPCLPSASSVIHHFVCLTHMLPSSPIDSPQHAVTHMTHTSLWSCRTHTTWCNYSSRTTLPCRPLWPMQPCPYLPVIHAVCWPICPTLVRHLIYTSYQWPTSHHSVTHFLMTHTLTHLTHTKDPFDHHPTTLWPTPWMFCAHMVRTVLNSGSGDCGFESSNYIFPLFWISSLWAVL